MLKRALDTLQGLLFAMKDKRMSLNTRPTPINPVDFANGEAKKLAEELKATPNIPRLSQGSPNIAPPPAIGEPPKAVKAKKTRAARAKVLSWHMDRLAELQRTKIVLTCNRIEDSQHVCKEKWSIKSSDAQTGLKARQGWQIAMLPNGSIGAYCPVHQPPSNATSVSFKAQDED